MLKQHKQIRGSNRRSTSAEVGKLLALPLVSLLLRCLGNRRRWGCILQLPPSSFVATVSVPTAARLASRTIKDLS